MTFSSLVAAVLMFLGILSTTTAQVTQTMTTIQNSSDIECYQCYGVMGEVSNCGRSLYPEDPINITSCAYSCAKIISYMIDQRIAIARDCVQDCEEGCIKDVASDCYHCCQSSLCNAASRVLSPTTSIWIMTLSVGLWCLSKTTY